jgi:hypothetical protein
MVTPSDATGNTCDFHQIYQQSLCNAKYHALAHLDFLQITEGLSAAGGGF